MCQKPHYVLLFRASSKNLLLTISHTLTYPPAPFPGLDLHGGGRGRRPLGGVGRSEHRITRGFNEILHLNNLLIWNKTLKKVLFGSNLDNTTDIPAQLFPCIVNSEIKLTYPFSSPLSFSTSILSSISLSDELKLWFIFILLLSSQRMEYFLQHNILGGVTAAGLNAMRNVTCGELCPTQQVGGAGGVYQEIWAGLTKAAYQKRLTKSLCCVFILNNVIFYNATDWI